MRVLLADTFQVYRRGMAAVLDRTPGVSDVVEAESAPRALQAAREGQPDLIILSEELAPSVLPRLAESGLAPRVILLVEDPAAPTPGHSSASPAVSRLPRNASIAQLLQVIGLIPTQQ